ncbi:glycosyltransferase family 4 protein [Methylomonas rapida]|uniref:Glycosyltransferase family 4 protein n=1 Tax=Methylomonas rapida TaxID=2963939 RepID=A0ABY7GFQ0_9GAMM|nr:glycosyltransferase family 4 protein [Methylomonas rapida]WAR44092.1 glycosyltransferase family 4 protein [Methylomonas rapida]
MKKILLLTRNFPPLTGGMERLNHHLYLELKKHFDVLVAGPCGSHAYLDSDTLFCEFSYKPLYAFLWSSFWKTLKFCNQYKPDLIIAGSGATALSARLLGYIFNIPVITFVHGLDLVLPNRLYQMSFLPAIRASDAIWVNSDNTKKLAINQRIKPEKIQIVYPGVTIPEMATTSNSANGFKTKLGLTEDYKILLSVGRLTERKGLPEFIRNCLPRIVKDYPRCVLVIIGNEPNNALHHKVGIKERIQETIQELGLTDHVRLLGHVDEAELAESYQDSHLHIFPGLDLPGDVEGFGMVAIEAAAHGLPTVAFAVGGVAEAVSHNQSGWLIEAGDYDGMIQTILSRMNDDDNAQKTVNTESCKDHAEDYSWDLFGARIFVILNELLLK